MLKPASTIRDIQLKATQEYERYKELEESISQLIFFSAKVQSNNCKYKLDYTEENAYLLSNIVLKLKKLGYKVFEYAEMFNEKDVLCLEIAW